MTHLAAFSLGILTGVFAALSFVSRRGVPRIESPPTEDEYAAWLAVWERYSR